MKKSLPDLALESAMIVFSVLLALAASSWADTRREHALVAQARGSFALEIRANRQRIAKVLLHTARSRALCSHNRFGWRGNELRGVAAPSPDLVRLRPC